MRLMKFLRRDFLRPYGTASAAGGSGKRIVRRQGGAALLMLSCCAMTAFSSGQTNAVAADWSAVQKLVGGIHGIATAPPRGVVTPKYTSGALMGNGDIGVVAGGTTTAECFYFGKSDFWGTHWYEGHDRPEVSILSLGSLTLSSPEQSSGADAVYRIDQDILNAQVLSTLKLGNAVVHVRSWTADGSDIFAAELTTDAGSEDVPLQLALAMPAPDAALHTALPSAAGAQGGMLWASRENNLDGATDYKSRAAIALRLIGASFTATTTAASSATGSFTLHAGESVWIVAAFKGDSRMGTGGPSSPELVQAALGLARTQTVASVAQLEAAHRQWWKRFWMRSLVQVHDKVLEDFYYGALYALGSSSRPGGLAPSLWGNFITTDDAKWGGRYFMNYNEEAPYYGAFSSNHADLAEPYNRMVLAQMPWQRNKTAEAGYKGTSFQRTFSPFVQYEAAPQPLPVAAEKDYKKLPSDQKSNATFSLLPVIDYYEYTGDKEFLRTQLYPALKQLDAFWRDFAVRDAAGRWSFEHTSAHEGGDDTNPNLDLGFARRVERELIETSQVLGVDAAMRPVWQQFLDQLAPYPTGTVNGKPVYLIASYVKNAIKDQGLFEPGDQPINLEGLVFPGENLAMGGDPQRLQIARNSMEEMNSWGVTRGGNSNNGFCKIFPIAARIGWPADDLVSKFKAAILYQWRPSNLTVFQGGGGIETAGSIEALDSMLMQHEDGVLRVFPDWPRTMDASFTHLLAKGAFLVSSEQSHGEIGLIDIISEHGGTLVVQSPWGAEAARVAEKGRPGSSRLKAGSDGRLTLVTQPGGEYRLTPVRRD